MPVVRSKGPGDLTVWYADRILRIGRDWCRVTADQLRCLRHKAEGRFEVRRRRGGRRGRPSRERNEQGTARSESARSPASTA